MSMRAGGGRGGERGFSLIEIMVTLIVVGIAMVGLMFVLQVSTANRFSTLNGIEARTKASAAMEMIAADLRGAGSGVDAGYATPQPAIAYVDSLELMLCGDFSGGAVAPVDTLAYSPSGTPRPHKLSGTYAPPIRYRTGAELIRWTLDINDDGIIGSGDIDASDGVDVRRTPNPNDYMLVRQVFADSLDDVAGDNGGVIGRVAPILAPGGDVPPLFMVTLVDGTTWNWSSGPVPKNKLKDIASITVHVTAESGRADTKGRYGRTTLMTTVSLKRIG
jgi:prepilin-type N-terminal cleavage/methylation domain-containing protein